MVISYTKKFIFIHIYKTAGTSISNIFGKHSKISMKFSEVWPTKYLVKAINIWFRLDDNGNKWINGVHKHGSCKDVHDYLGGDVYREFYKFSFVRNPFDLQYSLWSYIKGSRSHVDHKLANNLSFEEFIDRQIKNNTPCQIDFLKIEGKVSVDFIGYFEDLSNSMSDLMKQLELPYEDIPRLNFSNRVKKLQSVYSDKLINDVYEHFKEDFIFLHYSKDINNLYPEARVHNIGKLE